MRLGQYLAKAGVASRRKVVELIKAGHVTISNKVVINPAEEINEAAEVRVGGKLVKAEPREYWLVHKPVGVVSTARDTHGRPVVTSLVKTSARLYPVGRLDADSSGLMLLTNDGDLTNALTHPRYEVPKTYRVKVAGRISDRSLQQLKKGVELEDGLTAPANVIRASGSQPGAGSGDNSVFDITIHEGRNRQVRRMCETVGHRVISLQRRSLGPLQLGQLAEGKARRLANQEQAALKKISGSAPTD